MEISALGPLEKLKESIKIGDEKIFVGIPGIGGKRAKKILLELSGKIKDYEPAKPKEKSLDDPSFNALVNMGFSKQEAREALAKFPKEMDTESKIKEALRILDR